MRGLAVTAVVLIAAPGCRQLFGIDDTDVAADASHASDGATRADAPPGTPDAGPDAPPPDGALPVVCPGTYQSIPGAAHQYRDSTNNRPWDSAVSECAADDALGHTHLVVIEDAFEWFALEGAIGHDYWTGATDQVDEGAWVTVLGTAQTYLPWDAGEPNGGITENCLKVANGTRWLDADCPNANHYVCECE